jgi:hypothetical protein
VTNTVVALPAPKPQRQPLFKFWNRTPQPAAVKVDAPAPVVTQAVATEQGPALTLPPPSSPAEETKKPEPLVVAGPTVVTEPPQPGDWRQSWGKPDLSRPAPPAELASQGVIMEEKSAPIRPPLPVAEAKGPDPLHDPESYLRRPLPPGPLMKRVEEPVASAEPPPVVDTSAKPEMPPSPAPLVPPAVEPAAVKAPEPPAPVPPAPVSPPPTPTPLDLPPLPAPSSAPDLPPLPASEPVAATTPAPTVVEPAATAAPEDQPAIESAPTPGAPVEGESSDIGPPPGSASVLAAGDVQFVPVPIVTVPDHRNVPKPPPPMVPRPPQPVALPPGYVPTPVCDAQDELNAFSPPTKGPNVFGSVRQPVPPTPPPPTQAMARWNPAAPPAGPNPAGVMPAAATQPQMPPVNPQQAVARMEQQTAGLDRQVALAVVALREALLPSEREMATIQLGRCDWRSNGPVIEALISAAKEDPAASVRAACVRALVKMNVNTVPVVAALQALRSDNDPRVQQEVTQALAVLAAGLANQEAQGVQPPQ